MHPFPRIVSLTILLMAASVAPGQVTLRYRFKEKERLYYNVEQKTKSTMNVAGAELVANLDAGMSLYWEIAKVNTDGSAQVRVKFTYSKMTFDSLLGMVTVDSKGKDAAGDAVGRVLSPVNKAIAEMEITATMLPTGELRDLKVSEATIRAFKALPSGDMLGDLAHPDNFRDLISSVVFAPGTVVKGKSWTHKSVSQAPEGKLNTENVYTLEDPVTQDGVTLQKIALSPTITVEANPQAKMTVKSMKSTGFVLFDNNAGRVVESVVKSTKQGRIDIMGLAVDSTNEQTTTWRLKKAGDIASEIDTVKIDESQFVEKSVATEMLETIAGVSRSVTLERNYEPGIVLEKGTPSDSLKAKVEAALGITLGKRAQAKESITLDGKNVTKLNVHWVERYRRGTATASDGSSVSFLVRVGLRLQLDKAK